MSRYMIPLMKSFIEHISDEEHITIKERLKTAIDENNFFEVIEEEMVKESNFRTLSQLESVFKSTYYYLDIWEISIDDFIVIPDITSYSDFGRYIVKKYSSEIMGNFIEKMDSFDNLGYEILHMLEEDYFIFNTKDKELMISLDADYNDYTEREILEDLELL